MFKKIKKKKKKKKKNIYKQTGQIFLFLLIIIFKHYYIYLISICLYLYLGNKKVGVSRQRAIEALDANNGDHFNTILELTADNETSSAGGGGGGMNQASALTHKLTLEKQPFYWLEVLSPQAGWILDTTIDRSANTNTDATSSSTCSPGEAILRRGSLYEASRWVYKVVCTDGAFIREGIFIHVYVHVICVLYTYMLR